MVPAGSKAKPLSSVNHTSKTIHQFIKLSHLCVIFIAAVANYLSNNLLFGKRFVVCYS